LASKKGKKKKRKSTESEAAGEAAPADDELYVENHWRLRLKV